MVRAPLPMELLEELIVPYISFLHMHMLFEYAMKRINAFSSLMLVLFGLLYFCMEYIERLTKAGLIIATQQIKDQLVLNQTFR